MFYNGMAKRTYKECFAIIKPFLNVFAQVALWQFKVLSYNSTIIQQMQETICDVTYLNVSSGKNENSKMLED